MDTCRSCKAPVIWAVTPKGKRAIIDAEADNQAKGNVYLIDLGADQITLAVTLSGEALNILNQLVDLRTDHHATCPDVEEWRGK